MAKRPGQFKKGQSGNPKGRPKDPPDLKEAKQLCKKSLTKTLNKYLFKTKSELLVDAKNPETTMLEHVVIKVLVLAEKHGDHKRLDWLIERIIGKVKEELEVSGSVHSDIMGYIEKKK